jgi:membrane-bound metal-dependent hydrolase YbcI (DUF457 family)
MTPIGHTVIGAAIGVIAARNYGSTGARSIVIAGFVFAANAPDFALPGWGHDRYQISHSAIVLAGICMAISGLWYFCDRNRRICPSTVTLLCLSLMSHIVLDAMYSHGRGLRVLWPVDSTTRLVLPVPWLHLGASAGTTWLQVGARELITFGGVGVLMVGLDRLVRRSPPIRPSSG